MSEEVGDEIPPMSFMAGLDEMDLDRKRTFYSMAVKMAEEHIKATFGEDIFDEVDMESTEFLCGHVIGMLEVVRGLWYGDEEE
tara:strand:- start:2072 stop:2320 length:249 start_codon:yes stop_codon:yes gene_type:complete